jgi:hypothetical protein
MHGETIAQTICGSKTPYRPGIWFNSAKFLDIEYQVYGHVRNHPAKGEKHLYWEHPSGRHALRLVYEVESEKLLGVNLMGIRYRHEVCDHWLKHGYTIEQVLPQLKKANFDPEFYPEYEEEIIRLYNLQQNKIRIKSLGKRGVYTSIADLQ